MATKQNATAATVLNKDDQIVIGGAGGFIAGALVRVLPRPGIHTDSGDRQKAPAAVVPADAGRGVFVSGPEPGGQLQAGL